MSLYATELVKAHESISSQAQGMKQSATFNRYKDKLRIVAITYDMDAMPVAKEKMIAA